MDKTQLDRVRQGLVAAAIPSGLVIGATGDYGDTDTSSLVIPALYAFAIWPPIYAGSLAYAAHQARPARVGDPLLRRTGYPAATAYLLVGTWVHAGEQPWLQVPLIGATMTAAALAYARAGRQEGEPDSRADQWLVRVPLGLFTGWVTLATAAATTEALLTAGARDLGLGPPAWALIVLGTAAGVGVAVTRSTPVSLAYPAAVTWGLVGVTVRLRRQRSSLTAAAVVAAAAVGTAALTTPAGQVTRGRLRQLLGTVARR